MNLKLKLNLSNRITVGYMIIIAVALLTTGYSIYSLQRNKRIDWQIQKTYLPLYLQLKDLSTLNQEGAKLTNHWIYQSNVSEKGALIKLHKGDYPALKKNITETLLSYNGSDGDAIRRAIRNFDDVILLQEAVMSTLHNDSLYANDAAVDSAILLWDGDISASAARLDYLLERLLNSHRLRLDRLQEKKEQADAFLSELQVGMIMLFVLAFVITYVYAKKSIVEPIVDAKNLIVSLGQGKLINIPVKRRGDEIGEMMLAMNSLMRGMNTKSEFADQIGKGNYGGHFDLQGPEDVMGRALLNMRDQLKKKNAEMDRFVYSASHDLRSPIASVKGLVNLVRLDTSAATLDHCLVLINKSMDRLDTVISEILDFFQNSRSEVKSECVDILELVDEVISGFSMEPCFREITFSIRHNLDRVPRILTDRGRMKLILNNFIDNAIQFRSQKVSPEIVIDIYLESHLMISVQDNGIGIAPKYHDRIFSMFFRGDADRSRSGLGLYIVREVVNALSGTITFKSNVDQGSRFTVRVPVEIWNGAPEQNLRLLEENAWA
ncbi:MAG TPA: ATP-binding protein [Chryseolinea sp.]